MTWRDELLPLSFLRIHTRLHVFIFPRSVQRIVQPSNRSNSFGNLNFKFRAQEPLVRPLRLTPRGNVLRSFFSLSLSLFFLRLYSVRREEGVTPVITPLLPSQLQASAALTASKHAIVLYIFSLRLTGRYCEPKNSRESKSRRFFFLRSPLGCRSAKRNYRFRKLEWGMRGA